jgi:hypothetical protein
MDSWRSPQTIDHGSAPSAQDLVQLTGSASRD